MSHTEIGDEIAEVHSRMRLEKAAKGARAKACEVGRHIPINPFLEMAGNKVEDTLESLLLQFRSERLRDETRQRDDFSRPRHPLEDLQELQQALEAVSHAQRHELFRQPLPRRSDELQSLARPGK